VGDLTPDRRGKREAAEFVAGAGLKGTAEGRTVVRRCGEKTEPGFLATRTALGMTRERVAEGEVGGGAREWAT
jgi:hypothetical protein